ncbi:hypothetical protein BC777_1784 [Yoonia maricola]|uniref:Thymidylate kinase n=1 Tax=Yoonia maricola TaxID=420999 RepID=A0A2M8WPR1_9RHOB|nr:hypothetical protein [Yoonia maricola]PJI92919.1 hypothetical protein BC777_1784 [Yoonia maricola]
MNRPSGRQRDRLSDQAAATTRLLCARDPCPMIVLTAGDGAGKSTLLAGLEPLMQDVAFCSIDPTFLYPLQEAPHMDWALQTHPREVIWKCAPMVRSAFFVTTFSVLVEHYVKPNFRRRPIIIDSYWYRYLAKEMLQNPDGANVFADLTQRLPRPDLVVELTCDYSVAFSRKDSISPLETGSGINPQEDFIHFQYRVAQTVNKLLPADVPRVNLRSTTVAQTTANFLATIDAWIHDLE